MPYPDRCRDCGYDLHGIRRDNRGLKCPECGRIWDWEPYVAPGLFNPRTPPGAARGSLNVFVRMCLPSIGVTATLVFILRSAAFATGYSRDPDFTWMVAPVSFLLVIMAPFVVMFGAYCRPDGSERTEREWRKMCLLAHATGAVGCAAILLLDAWW